LEPAADCWIRRSWYSGKNLEHSFWKRWK